MTVQAIQFNTNFGADSVRQRTVKPYREATGTITTEDKVHPLPPQGHLVDDTLAESTKYFFKDIGYDFKSVKNGYLGTANDHQLGRLNDVGLRLGGIGIATYLASQTTNPRARLMEYIGLAMFLTSMAIYPKLAINTPAKLLHGYDIDKQYIDDQGRKKSVHQDSNYIPYDMYNGNNKSEDLDAIGDKMGIPCDIKNRHDVIREQMRKIATQNNTLWMLTAGIATPLMTALLCSGIEKFIVTPGLEKTRNSKFNSQISSLLEKSDSGNIANNSLGDSVKRLVSKYEGKSIPKSEVDNLIEILTHETDSILAEGIKNDVQKMISDGAVIKIDKKSLKKMYTDAEHSMMGAKTKYISDNILPSLEEIQTFLGEIKPEASLENGIELNKEEFKLLKSKIYSFSETKMADISGAAANHKDYIKSNVVKFNNSFVFESDAAVISKESGEKLVKFANIIGDFKNKNAILDKCENFKFEHTNETILANKYDKFQNTLLKQLDISPKDYKRMSNDKEFAQKILDEKISLLCQNEAKYNQTLMKLGRILNDMDQSLHGSDVSASHIKDLITAIDNVYNSAAQNLLANNIGEETANRLVKGSYGHTVESTEDVFALLNGNTSDKVNAVNSGEIENMKYFAKGKGSSKNLKISRLVNRYQGERNSFNRILQTLEFYNRSTNTDNLMKYSSVKDASYVKNLELKIKDALLKGSISDYILKLGVENPYEYRDLYNVGWVEVRNDIMVDFADGYNKIVKELNSYITRFKDIIANDRTDFTRPNHIIDATAPNKYSEMAKTNDAKFNLVAQSPVDMMQKAAGKKHADRMWLRTVGIIVGAVFGITLLGQFSFGRIKNKHNLQSAEPQSITKGKPVENESDK